MKLTVFDNETMPKQLGRTGVPRITFSKSGVIALNKCAVEALGISVGDKISFAQDDTEDAPWYAYVDETGFKIRAKDFEKNGNACFNHAELSKAIIESFGYDEDESKSVSLQLATEPVVHAKKSYYQLLGIIK